MSIKSKKRLAVSLHGMDGRTHKLMTIFLRGMCKDIVKVVEENKAEIDIIDADLMSAQISLDHCLARKPLRPIIVLSLQTVNIEHTIYVKKPVKPKDLLQAFKDVGNKLQKKEAKEKQLIETVAPIKGELDKVRGKITVVPESNLTIKRQNEGVVTTDVKVEINTAGKVAVSLFGMDEQTHEAMVLFLQEDCQDIARVVEEQDAEVDIIDADLMDARVSLDHCLARVPLRPIILLSLQSISIEHTIFVEKPASRNNMLDAFKKAGHLLGNKKETKGSEKAVKNDIFTAFDKANDLNDTKDFDVSGDLESLTALVKAGEKKSVGSLNRFEKAIHKASGMNTPPDPESDYVVQKNQKPLEQVDDRKVYVNHLDQNTSTKHHAAMMINEKGFSGFIGVVSDIDFSDPEQWQAASYNPKHYYQGYVESSIKLAYEKMQVLKLSSSWKPLFLLPGSHEIWLDADDKQLRAFAGVRVKSIPVSSTKIMAIAPVNLEEREFSNELDKFQEINAFLWKLACLTSKGRYIKSLDLSTPVYLKQWPNFTRLIITPHAMRISAILISSPRSAIDIIEALKIKPQYVFIFISAAYTVGILEQIKEQDVTKKMKPPVTKKEQKKRQKKGLLSRILNKLRG